MTIKADSIEMELGDTKVEISEAGISVDSK